MAGCGDAGDQLPGGQTGAVAIGERMSDNESLKWMG